MSLKKKIKRWLELRKYKKEHAQEQQKPAIFGPEEKIRVLGINGSLRGREGNSEKMLQKLLDHVRNYGGETERIVLKEKNIGTCEGVDKEWFCCGSAGSYYCQFPCWHKDDTNEVLQAIYDADCIVLATGNYWAGSSLIQNLIEKMTALEASHYKWYFETGKEPLLGKPVSFLCSQEVEGASLLLSRLMWACDHMGMIIIPWAGIFRPTVLNNPVARVGMRAIGYRKLDWVDSTIRAAAWNLVGISSRLKGYKFYDYLETHTT